jgi:hypothetical protein
MLVTRRTTATHPDEEERMTAQDAIPDPAQRRDDDRSVARWGGLAGIAGAVLLVVVFAIVGLFAGPDPAGPAGPIERFPEIRAVRTVENGLYLAVLALWVPLAVALSRALRGARPAAALFGGALNIVGLTVLAAGAIPHVVTSRLSDLYHADGATLGQQATLVLLWQANQGMFDALLLVGLLVMPAGVILLGLAMRRDPAFGRVAGTAGVALGSAGLAAATVMLVDPRSAAAPALGLLALVVFHLVAGWKSYRLATAAERWPADPRHGRARTAGSPRARARPQGG